MKNLNKVFFVVLCLLLVKTASAKSSLKESLKWVPQDASLFYGFEQDDLDKLKSYFDFITQTPMSKSNPLNEALVYPYGDLLNTLTTNKEKVSNIILFYGDGKSMWQSMAPFFDPQFTKELANKTPENIKKIENIVKEMSSNYSFIITTSLSPETFIKDGTKEEWGGQCSTNILTPCAKTIAPGIIALGSAQNLQALIKKSALSENFNEALSFYNSKSHGFTYMNPNTMLNGFTDLLKQGPQELQNPMFQNIFQNTMDTLLGDKPYVGNYYYSDKAGQKSLSFDLVYLEDLSKKDIKEEKKALKNLKKKFITQPTNTALFYGSTGGAKEMVSVCKQIMGAMCSIPQPAQDLVDQLSNNLVFSMAPTKPMGELFSSSEPNPKDLGLTVSHDTQKGTATKALEALATLTGMKLENNAIAMPAIPGVEEIFSIKPSKTDISLSTVGTTSAWKTKKYKSGTPWMYFSGKELGALYTELGKKSPGAEGEQLIGLGKTLTDTVQGFIATRKIKKNRIINTFIIELN